MNMQQLKRKLSAALMLLPLTSVLTACQSAAAMGQRPTEALSGDRFKGMGLTLVVDAVPGAEMLGVEFYADGNEAPFYTKSRMVKTNRGIMSFPSGKVPEKVRVIWRNSTELIRRKDNPNKTTYAGDVLGDYTIPVASRIPDEVAQDIRQNGGGLRLKFRLKPDGVLFGWDIERSSGEFRNYSKAEIQAKNMYFPPKYLQVGGDFLDTNY
jgi:hypothetical protein